MKDDLRQNAWRGRVVSLTLLAELPELSRLSHRGLPPGWASLLNRDSGTQRGKLLVYGGRALVPAAL